MSRRKGRILAFQALYSWDVTKETTESLLSFSWLQKEAAEDETAFASLIIAGTIDHIDEIDQLIETHLASNWSKDRINKVALAILRTSVYELKYQNDSQPGIIIDEAVNIAKDYGADDSYKFINAVLDKIGKNEEKS